ncbi:MAG: phosphate acyltransferase PlsX [Eubacterium sp.]|nr:phosphate acyltransferase PlsX [Eubacterium sp.]
MSAMDTIRVVVDAMGGDYAPQEPVKGAVDALKDSQKLRIQLVGQPEVIRQELAKYSYDKDRLEVIAASEIIETGESPVQAVRQKKDSSLVVGLTRVKDGLADAFVSSGNTGAVLAGGQLIVRRIKGVQRAPLAPLIPTEKGPALLIDCGANVDARASHLVQFAHIGSIYMESVMGIRNPRVALVNIGAEEEKGNALSKETYPLLAASREINFIGNIEARDIPKGEADVIVTEAFTGNVILKLYEGVGSVMISEVKKGLMTSLRSKIGAVLIKPALKKTLKKFDSSEYGGAPLLGLNGLVVKTHGSSKAAEFRNTILQCISFKEQDINGQIRRYLNDEDNLG